MRFFSLIALCLALASIPQGCTTYSTTSSGNLNVSHIYNPGTSPVVPNYAIFFENNTTTRVYIGINTGNLMYTRSMGQPSAQVRVSYKLYNPSNGYAVADSGNMVFYMKFDSLNPELTLDFPVKTPDTLVYFLDLTVYDKSQERGHQTFIRLDRKSPKSPYNVLVADSTGRPLFQNQVAPGDSFRIVRRSGLPDEWKMSWFRNNFPLAPLPHSIGVYKPLPSTPDSSERVIITDTSWFKAGERGIIHFQSDSSLFSGFTVHVFPKGFPDQLSPSQMLGPLRLLTSNKEFNDYNMLADKKEAVDKFWLESAGNPNRAKELIRVFYTRVKYANHYFTSYTEGWKTDRGMIYIVFGLPATIYKSETAERWIYGSSQGNRTVVFNFSKTAHPFSDNHFVLARDEMYRIAWNQAVETWRNGRIYSIGY
jgi:GWxTD domain-containing protein